MTWELFCAMWAVFWSFWGPVSFAVWVSYAHDARHKPRPMTGFLATLTDEQRARILSRKGDK